ncbi:transcription termination/antitermination protein NusG [Entomospira culicis]|uniref:Transcription termination/antitermination protein NusG n=1 Tax=Entomospira culicis TaxID=2719989 RepID=A0A968KX64_9SPIO|nr:transcription termination/antitermination protein NusG [Entomospira culicis]NIZ19798.1 transcription termination/antitermination factor NusG [Entomospira culicis]NIZ70012.1 transcription termination/antitermination factor NusG [Entomospira culicis]WDI37117.1 transcription termination/antitermination protein NusG [Entomospira culicis]WDI38746.1 transcription termination/antitermination protein NusG [Entomospira culicis]
MAKAWYVLSVFSGHENKVEKLVRMMMQHGDLDAVSDVRVPTEEVEEVVNGKKRMVSRTFLPGYLLLEMDLPERGWKSTLSNLSKINGVMGFVGQSGNIKPQPISAEEAKEILQKTGEIKVEKSTHLKQEYAIGEKVRIISGPFEGFNAMIEEVHHEKGMLRVSVVIFDRNTPLDIEYYQVERVSNL